MLQALQPHFDLVEVVERPFPAWFLLLRKVLRRLTGGSVDIIWTWRLVGFAAGKTIDTLVKADCDFVFAVAATPIAAHVVGRKPTVFVSDATQFLMSDYNPHHTAQSPWLKRSAGNLETRAISGARVALFPSNWAASSAVANHQGQAERVFTVPWGANLRTEERKAPPERAPGEDWRLLFIGVDWFGKGGDIAVEAISRMRAAGKRVSIDIVGSEPSTPPPQIDGVTFHGFLNKNDPADYQKLQSLFEQADLFFLPTRFDALGIVFAEAASYAIPAVSYATGGVPAMVLDGKTGILLEEGSTAEAFATAMTGLLEDPARYAAMSKAALEYSRSSLNWPAWGDRVAQILSAAVKP